MTPWLGLDRLFFLLIRAFMRLCTRIRALPEDDLFNFQISQPFNSDQTATIDGWEFAIQHRLWETGFGVQLNYTIVNADQKSFA